MITPQLKYMIAEKLSNEKLITKLSIISNSWNDICHNVIWDKREPIYVHKSPFRMNSFQIDNYNDITINVVNKWWSNINYAIYTGNEKSPLYSINDGENNNNNLGLGLLLSEDLQRQEEIFHKKKKSSIAVDNISNNTNRYNSGYSNIQQSEYSNIQQSGYFEINNYENRKAPTKSIEYKLYSPSKKLINSDEELEDYDTYLLWYYNNIIPNKCNNLKILMNVPLNKLILFRDTYKTITGLRLNKVENGVYYRTDFANELYKLTNLETLSMTNNVSENLLNDINMKPLPIKTLILKSINFPLTQLSSSGFGNLLSLYMKSIDNLVDISEFTHLKCINIDNCKDLYKLPKVDIGSNLIIKNCMKLFLLDISISDKLSSLTSNEIKNMNDKHPCGYSNNSQTQFLTTFANENSVVAHMNEKANNYISETKFLNSTANIYEVSPEEKILMERNNMATRITDEHEIILRQQEMFDRMQSYRNFDISNIGQSNNNTFLNTTNNSPHIFFNSNDIDIMNRLDDRHLENQQLNNIQYQNNNDITPPFLS